MGQSINTKNIKLIETKNIKPIESHSKSRAQKIKKKIIKEGWRKPIVVFHNLEKNIYHVLDGHHRNQVAKDLFLKKIPAIVVEDYKKISIRSLRKEFNFTHEDVIDKSVSCNIYPYKTVKHDFNFIIPEILISLEDLKGDIK